MNEAVVNAADLPGSWVLTTLGAVVQYGSAEKAEPKEIADDDWVLELEDIEKDSSRLLQKMIFLQRQSKSTKNSFHAGDVLYGKLRPYLNKVLIADEPGYCTTEILPLNAGTHLDNRYLFYWLKHPVFLKYVEAESHGMNMPRLGTDAGKAAPFVLAPRGEQTRIADQLDTLLTRIQSCNDRFDAIPALLKRFRQAVLAAAVSGALTKEWQLCQQKCEPAEVLLLRLKRDRPEHLSHEPRSLEGLFSLPTKWRWSNLQFLLSPHEQFCYGVVQPGADDPNGILMVRAGDLKQGTVDVGNLRRIPIDIDREYRRSKLRGGELLVTVVGAGIGESSIAPPETTGFNIARAVAKLPIRDINAKYVHLWLQSTTAIQLMKSDSREVARPTLNLEQLKTLPIRECQDFCV